MAITRLRPFYGPWIDDAGFYGDKIRWRVPGATDEYQALLALQADGKGRMGAHPIIPGIVGQKPTMVDVVRGAGGDGTRDFLFETTYGRPPAVQASSLSVVRYRLKYGFYQVKADMDVTGQVDPGGPLPGSTSSAMSAGNAIVNSAGDPYNPPEPKDCLCIILTCLKYVTTFSLPSSMNYINHVNMFPITICSVNWPRRCVLCRNYAPPGEFTAATTPIEVATEFEMRLENFDRKILDAGFRAWYTTYAGAAGEAVGPPDQVHKGRLIMRGTPATPPAQPALLNGKGFPLNPTGTMPDWTGTASGFSILDPNFVQFAPNPDDPFPDYISPSDDLITLISGAILIPYQMKEVADFSAFATMGF